MARNDSFFPERPSTAEHPNPICGARRPVLPSSIASIGFHFTEQRSEANGIQRCGGRAESGNRRIKPGTPGTRMKNAKPETGFAARGH
jgi:hypothetical protein